MKQKIAVIFGTRPEAIKLAPVVLELKKQPAVDCRVCVTAQHRALLDQVLEAFDLAADADLNLMVPRQTLAGLTARAIESLDRQLALDRPDLVLVQGDTTTAFCSALCSAYHGIPVGHVEAGLRTGNLQSPWPEEVNRVLTARLSRLHFAPTERAGQNLLAEGVPPENIFVTGNTVIDALFLARKRIEAKSPQIPGLPPHGGPLVLITAHRRESFGPVFENICRAIAELARRLPGVQFVYPVHLNPSVREPAQRILGCLGQTNLHLLEPLPYLAFVALLHRATLILTDSGGLQEEAPSLGKPVLVMRQTTERPEAVAAGAAKLVGTDYERIVAETERLLTDQTAYRAMARPCYVYGDGAAAARIVRICLEQLPARQESWARGRD